MFSKKQSSQPVGITLDKPAPKKRKKKPQADGMRETVESIAIAFILAFLFKTFQAEAYVIPTGSMAPTLYGRHKEITCDGCGFCFALGASSELDQGSGNLMGRIDGVYCANCGKRNEARSAPVFNGDRIVVNKQVSQFRRFDVVVFKNPEQGHVNYIKRLVGLPNETIHIRKGDIWAKSDANPDWKILRKDDESVQKEIQLTVYDDQYPATQLLELGWPERWAPSVQDSGAGSIGGWLEKENKWTPDRSTRKYSCKADGDDTQWLRYRHFLPSESTWPHPEEGRPLLPPAEASLISDFCSFNAYDPFQPGMQRWEGGIYWVGDLTLNATVDVRQPNGEVVLELVDGPETFQCVVQLSSGEAILQSRDSQATGDFQPIASGSTSMSAAGEFSVSFANVDDRLCLWVDDRLIEFDASTEYERPNGDIPQPGQKDLSPSGIGCKGGDIHVSDLLLQRDIYYRNDVIAFDPEDGLLPQSTYSQEEVRHKSALSSLLRDPESWTQAYAQQTAEQLETYGPYGEYKLESDEYLMFGDNSSMSKDGRLFDYEARPMNGIFSHRYAVREKDLIGKALYIFWPHGVPFTNGGEGVPLWSHKGMESADPQDYPYVRVPFYPNIHRMQKIR